MSVKVEFDLLTFDDIDMYVDNKKQYWYYLTGFKYDDRITVSLNHNEDDDITVLCLEDGKHILSYYYIKYGESKA